MGLHKIKLIEKDTDISSLDMIKLDWDVVINDIPYQLVRIKGYNHTIRGYDDPNNLWAYPRGEEPSYENLVEFSSDHPVQWGIIYQPRNYIRYKYDESEVFTSGGATITRNGKPFYICDGGFDYAIALAKVVITKLQDHPIEVNKYEFDKKVIGRKVWWRSQPGVITSYIHGQACVIIEPDGIDYFNIPTEFDNDMDRCMFEEFRDDVKVEIFDDHINWFRD